MRRLSYLVVVAFSVFGFGASSLIKAELLDEEGVLHIRGSDTVAYVLRKVSEAYMEKNPGAKVLVSGGGTWRGYKSVVDGTADIGMFSAPLPDDLKAELLSSKLQLSVYTLAVDAVVPIVNPANHLSNVSSAALRDIFSGYITNWQNISGGTGPIKVLSREVHSGSFELWRETVLTPSRALASSAKQLGSSEIMAQVGSATDVIGYTTFVNLKDSVKAVSVDGVSATRESIANGTYPLWRRIGLVAKAKTSPRVADFLAFVIAKDYGIKMAQEANWIISKEIGKSEPLSPP